MHEDHVALAGLQDVDDVGQRRAHIQIAPGEARPHAAEHGDQRRARVRAEDRELVADAKARRAEPPGDAVAQAPALAGK